MRKRVSGKTLAAIALAGACFLSVETGMHIYVGNVNENAYIALNIARYERATAFEKVEKLKYSKSL